MSKSQLVRPPMRFIKRELDIRRFKHNKVNFEVTYEGHPNCSKS